MDTPDTHDAHLLGLLTVIIGYCDLIDLTLRRLPDLPQHRQMLHYIEQVHHQVQVLMRYLSSMRLLPPF